MLKTAYALKAMVEGLDWKARDGAETYQFLVYARCMQRLREVGCSLLRYGLKI